MSSALYSRPFPVFLDVLLELFFPLKMDTVSSFETSNFAGDNTTLRPGNVCSCRCDNAVLSLLLQAPALLVTVRECAFRLSDLKQLSVSVGQVTHNQIRDPFHEFRP